MKRQLLTAIATVAITFIANAQNKLYDFPFDNSLSAITGTGTFSSSGTAFTTDRNSNANNALNLTSVATTATLTNIPTGSSSRTISLWFNRQGAGNTSLFSYGTSGSQQALEIYFNGSGGLVLGTGGGASFALGISGVSHNTWHHLALTYDGSTEVKVYFNGNLASTQTTNILNTASSLFQLGNVQGYFDDLKIYDDALTATQVQQLNSHNNLIQPTSLVDHYTFDNTLMGTSGHILANVTGNYVNDRNGNLNSAHNVSNTSTNIGIPNLPIGNDSRTLAFWYQSNAQSTHSLFNYGPSSNYFGVVYVSSPSSILVGSGNSADYSTPITYTGNWTHVAVTHSVNTTKVYINGVLAGTTSFTFNIPANPISRLGISPFGGSFGNYKIDDLFIYNYAMTDSEVSDLYNTTSIGIPETTITNSELKIYPNPANETLNISVDKSSQISISNVLGTIISTQALEAGENSINISNLASGVYFIQTQNGAFSKFIKE